LHYAKSSAITRHCSDLGAKFDGNCCRQPLCCCKFTPRAPRHPPPLSGSYSARSAPNISRARRAARSMPRRGRRVDRASPFCCGQCRGRNSSSDLRAAACVRITHATLRCAATRQRPEQNLASERLGTKLVPHSLQMAVTDNSSCAGGRVGVSPKAGVAPGWGGAILPASSNDTPPNAH
jgi:hypothetical protein